MHAPDLEQARIVARQLDEAYPALLATVPGLTTRPADVWIQDRLAYSWWQDTWAPFEESSGGVTFSSIGRIQMRNWPDPLRHQVLYHELVHLLHDEDWESLPHYLEEGLASEIALRLVPEQANRLRGVEYLNAVRAMTAVEINCIGPITLTTGVAPREDADLLETLTLDEAGPADPIHRGLGLFVVERIVERLGYAGFHALCRRARASGHARIPVDVLLEAADLPRDAEEWLPILVEGLSDEDRAGMLAAGSLIPIDAEWSSFRRARPWDPLDPRILQTLAPRIDLSEGVLRIVLTRTDVRELEASPEAAAAGRF